MIIEKLSFPILLLNICSYQTSNPSGVCSIQEDDFLILCTDGVWAYIEDNEFADIALDRRSPEQIGQTLIESALARDSDDNVSSLVIHVAQLVSSGATHENNRFSFTQFILGRLTGKTS